MATSFDLMSIYGIPPARYSEDNPDDLFLKGLPSLEQIASFNLANVQQNITNTQTMQGMQSSQSLTPIQGTEAITSTPATSVYGGTNTDITGVLMPSSGIGQGSASSELPAVGGNISQAITDYSKPFPVTAESIQYLNGFIRTQIGRRAQIQFLMGNAELIEKDGFLLGVGSNYILINEIGTNDITACDFYNIKFIRFLY